MSSSSSLGKQDMELYALIAVAIITYAFFRKKPQEIATPLDLMDLDDVVDCPQPPSPMSTDSELLLVDPNYIK